jgi:hypothetical protein
MRLFNILLNGFGSRLPLKDEILSVFNVMLFVVFGWSVRGFLFVLPSFLLYFRLGDIIAILFYMLGFALIESLFLTGGLLVGSLLLPAKWLKIGFGYKGFLIIFVATIGLILFQGYYKYGFFETLIKNDYSTLRPVFIGFIVSIFTLAGLLWLFRDGRSRLRNYLLVFIEQFGVFAYIYIPLGVIGVIVVVLRNIL